MENGFSATDFEDTLVSTLHTARGNTSAAPVSSHSVAVGNLQHLNTRTDIQLVQLVDADAVNPDGSVALVAPCDKPDDFAASGNPRSVADLLTASGLAFVKGSADASGDGFADPQAETAYGMGPGMDGVFTDFPDPGVAAGQAAAVPEPQTWALLLGGRALLDASKHRRG